MKGWITLLDQLQAQFPGYKVEVDRVEPGHNFRTITVFKELKEVNVTYWYEIPTYLVNIWEEEDSIDYDMHKLDKSLIN